MIKSIKLDGKTLDNDIINLINMELKEFKEKQKESIKQAMDKSLKFNKKQQEVVIELVKKYALAKEEGI